MPQLKRIFPAVPACLSLLVCLAALLSGCDSGTSPAGTSGTALTPGHYFIQSDADDSYRYDQYFVALPGNRWEFVEYGYDKADKTNLCQVTRQAGTYAATDSTLTVTVTAAGESLEKCHMTKADFQGYNLVNVPSRPTQAFPIRNLTPSGFEGQDLFIDNSGWKLYAITADPYGFY